MPVYRWDWCVSLATVQVSLNEFNDPFVIACHCSEWIGKLLKKSMTLNSDKYIILKQRNWICDVTPLQDDLGFIPAYPLRKGLEESIEWYKKEGWL